MMPALATIIRVASGTVCYQPSPYSIDETHYTHPRSMMGSQSEVTVSRTPGSYHSEYTWR